MSFSIAAAGSRLCLFALILAVSAYGQPATRVEEIQQARLEKANSVEPETVHGTISFLNKLEQGGGIEAILTGASADGFQPLLLGGTRSGNGTSIGIGYQRRDLLKGNLTFRASARASTGRSYLFDVELSMPRLANERVSFDLLAVHENSPLMDYYGPGPDSMRSDRTSYRLEDTGIDLSATVTPLGHVRLGATGGLYIVNTGPGGRAAYASIEEVFTPQTTPGLDEQPAFLRAGGFAQLDWRDNPGGPHSGGNLLARFSYYDDQDFDRYSFRRLDLEAEHYFPYFNQRRVVAVKAISVLSFSNAGQRVPFYRQPYVGSSHDLRGFRRYRFRDDNMVFLSAEHRWEAFSGLDMAIFFDAGKVAPRRSEINFRDLEASTGFGFRFNIRNDTFMRLDFGFSHEGVMFWWTWSDVYETFKQY